jgi:D-alanyl-lipoteichoic acid acyltransferase DltB (MBOAT superfamily)
MIFNSWEFLIFFPAVTLLFFLLPHKLRWLMLLTASCYFYMAFIPAYILILFATIVIDYFAGILIESGGPNRKLWLILSICANIGALAFFKYYNFIADNLNAVLGSAGFTHLAPSLNIILPIGLSFHTFQALSYTIEVYRKNQKAERHFGIYALYVMFYPQLVAGPIERPQNVLHQFHEKKFFSSELFISGMRLMLWGFFKKLVIADRLAIYVNGVHEHLSDYGSVNLVIAAIFFSIEIYCDFSGYSDIALGSARVMGFDLMTNFNRPYFAENIRDFWSKWHISLSTWFRDYLYIPLGGNRVSRTKTYLNILIVFVLSGLWHGANWTFILWGFLHGAFTIIYMMMKSGRKKSRIYKIAAMLFTFLLVTIAWIPFRANSIGDAWHFITNMLGFSGSTQFSWIVTDNRMNEFGMSSMIVALISIAVLFIIESRSDLRLLKYNSAVFADIAFCTAILLLVLVFGVYKQFSFIYFQF